MARPSKRSKEQNELEDQLRNMILGNVRIAPDTARTTEISSRGRGRGSAGRGYSQSRHSGYQQTSTLSNDNTDTTNAKAATLNQSANQSGPQTAVLSNSDVSNRNTGFLSSHAGRGGRIFSDRGGHPQNPGATQQSQSGDRTFRRQNFNDAHPARGPRRHHAGGPPDMSSFIAQCEMLEMVAAEEIPKVEMFRDEYDEKQAFCAHLEAICQQEVRATFPQLQALLYLRLYGSIASGFATKGSDVDLTIQWSGFPREDPEFKAWLPRFVEGAILREGRGARLLSRTRVPIIKICESPHDELFAALYEERQNWEKSPEEEKYPSLISKPDPSVDEGLDEASIQNHSVDEIDPDVSRTGKKMDTVKRVTMQDDPTKFLEQLKSTKRNESDDLSRYSTQFINARRFALDNPGQPDTLVAQWFLEGLPPSVSDEITQLYAHEMSSAAEDAQRSVFDTYYRLAQPIIARLARTKKKDRVWIREKALGKLDYPKHGVGIQCDLNFSNPLGIHNTELLRLYSLCDPRVRPMILFVKAWTKSRRINSAYNGTLSSYGYVLMVLHFLLNVTQPPVLPNLQHIFGADQQEVLFDGYNISFFRDEHHIRQMAAQHQWTQNIDPLGALLRNFFQYYAVQGRDVIGFGFNWMKEVISIRTPRGIVSKEYKEWTGARTDTVENREIRQRYLLAIEDPFETTHNVGRPVTHNGIVTIRDEFRRAWRILTAVGRGAQPEGGLFDQIEDAAPEKSTAQDIDQQAGDVTIDAVQASDIA